MRSSNLLAAIVLLALPLIASAEDDDVVIVSVTPRDPSVKGEILLTPARGKTAPVKVAKLEDAEIVALKSAPAK